MTLEAKPGSIEKPYWRRGAGAIFHIKSTDQFMFFLRDDKDSIPCPNMVDIIGGHLEGDEATGGEETARKGALREIAEELEDVQTGQPFEPGELDFFDSWVDDRGVQHNIFGCELETVPDIRTNEGQGLVFLNRDELAATDFAFGYRDVVLRYAATV